MAIAWWMDTGVFSKMAKDVKSIVGSNLNFWTRPKIRGNRPLVLSHALPSLIICGVLLFLSTVVFVLEVIHRYSQCNGKQKNGLNLRKEPKQSPKKSTGTGTKDPKITRSKDIYKIQRTRSSNDYPLNIKTPSEIHNKSPDKRLSPKYAWI